MIAFEPMARFSGMSLCVLGSALALAVPASADTLGETFTCHFGRHGKAVIDTRDPGATLTIGGRTYPIEGGSYFYATRDGKIVIFFGPRMKYWEYDDIRDNHCRRRLNRPSRQRN